MGRYSSSRAVRQWGRGSTVVIDKDISTDRLLDRHELCNTSLIELAHNVGLDPQ